MCPAETWMAGPLSVGAVRERTVLKYHCMPRLRTEPPFPLACTEALDDPIGFIAVDNGKTADFTVLFDP